MKETSSAPKRFSMIPSYVWELVSGIWITIFVMLLVCFVFPKNIVAFDKPDFALGLLVGGIAASLGAYHLWYTLNIALCLGEGGAVKKLAIHNTIRYLCFAAVIAFAGLYGRPNVIGVFFGIFALKPGAYLQPLVHKLVVRLADRS